MVPFSQITKRQKHYGGGLLLVRLKPASLLKLRLLHGCFSHFLNCTNSNKSRKTSHIVLIFCFSICIFSYGYWWITRQKENVGSQSFSSIPLTSTYEEWDIIATAVPEMSTSYFLLQCIQLIECYSITLILLWNLVLG